MCFYNPTTKKCQILGLPSKNEKKVKLGVLLLEKNKNLKGPVPHFFIA